MGSVAFAVNDFDVFEFVEESKKFGVNEGFAQLQAKKFLEFSKTIHDQQIEIEALKENEPATKKDLEIVKLELQKEIAELNGSLRKEIAELNGSLRKEIAETSGSLRKEIAEVNSTLIKEIKNLEVKLLFIYSSGFIALLGVLAKGFHWL